MKAFKPNNLFKGEIAIDARGFILASPIAYKINCGVCLVRKQGKLPYKTIKENYQKEYGVDLELDLKYYLHCV